ncbi:unnamed protein product [Sphenostylis stenocarpa]|uniref:Protein kinase domain-containing protein n=1 Tax=Sphenostylis stenocarpa TaxID=92480 RepID=A0AA86SWM1_9FABA|nr:unnamed protein product [Sphenostylis stenocarpa]
MTVLPSCSRCAQSVVTFLATILLLFQQTCNAKHHPICSPSSCGKIRNITYPFRLKTDPHGCGLSSYELDCVNNLTVLNLFPEKFYVQDIDYKGRQIRLTDAGIVEDTVCSLPRYFLSSSNFTSFGTGFKSFVMDPPTFSYSRIPPFVVFLNCSNRVSDDPRYVEVNGGRCDSGGYIYVVLDSNEPFRLMGIQVGCRLKTATCANFNYSRNVIHTNQTNDRNVSYSDILKLLEDGFWLSWLPLICRDQCGIGTDICSINKTTQQIQCGQRGRCHILGSDSDHCGTLARMVAETLRYFRVIIIGFSQRIKDVKRSLALSDSYGTGADLIGQDVIPILIVVRYLLGVTLLLGLLIYMWRRRHFSMYENIENFLLDNNLNPIRYGYKEIKKMTKGFTVKLGQGGFGAVYKGKLGSGLDVAVKMLSKSNDNGQDFINEVATIGTIHHVNVVRLIGYCVDRKKRALVYEYMPNGSLDKYIFSSEKGTLLSYEKIYEISLGIADGIAYLHQGCDMQILHFDIKPHNILLDANFVPKVSDFGLAKLHAVNDGVVNMTAARGTLGYMAPELFYKNMGGVTYKADVYSFGMLLMEMASRRRNSNPHAEHSSQHYFPFWIYDQFKEEKNINIEDASEEDNILAKKMFLVALWCIQLNPTDRPSMNKVMEMLEGKIENLELPPRPSFYKNESYRHDDVISDQASSTNSSYSDR